MVMSDDDLGNYKLPNPYMGELYEPVKEEDIQPFISSNWDTENPNLNYKDKLVL